MKLFLSALVVLATSCVACYGISLYPYGNSVNDNKLANGANPAVTVQSDVKYFFYGKDYDHLCLSDNGFVSFGGPVSSNDPKPLPVTEGARMVRFTPFIAAYWSDVDIRCDGGHIYYRTTQDPVLLDELHDHILMSGSGASFVPKEAFIVTWEGVMSSLDVQCDGQTNKRIFGPGKEAERNTFQLALVTDGVDKSYAILRYAQLEWATYTSPDGSIVRGPATAGFNAGDETNGMSLNLMPLPQDVIYLTLQSNVGYGGVFVCRMDLGPSLNAQVRLMANQMLIAQTAEAAGVEEAELYVPFKDIIYSGNLQSHQDTHEPQVRYNDYEVRRPSRPYIQRARDEDVNNLSYELQRIKY